MCICAYCNLEVREAVDEAVINFGEIMHAHCADTLNSDFEDDWEEEDCEDGCGVEDDGQPSSYEEYQDLYGGDDWDHGQYDMYEDGY